MTTLTITSKGQVTLRKNLLRHLGVAPGQKIEVREMTDGRVEVRAAKPAGSLKHFSGLLAGKSKRAVKKAVTIEEMNQAIAHNWAGRK